MQTASDYAVESVRRFTVNAAHGTVADMLDRDQLKIWVDGGDPVTGEKRGRTIAGANADLLFDATVNTPKSLSVAAMLDDELQAGLDALHDRIRDRALKLWLDELNSRRGAAGAVSMGLAQIEVVELRHERSRALDPHAHRHLWLNAKVLGEDGRWSNVDSRVMLRFQTILNAEGDLATTSDPQWRALLARKGLRIDEATGEIMQLAHLVRPLSRRAQQIDAARAVKLAQWREQHPGQEPSKQDLAAMDQWAWGFGRPNKPKHFDESQWREQVLSEIRGLDPNMADVFAGNRSLKPVRVAGVKIGNLDRDALAATAVALADARSMSTSSRFSLWDLRAAVVRAITASGVVADRAMLDEVVEDVTARALAGSVNDLATTADTPAHVRRYVATATAASKTTLEQQLVDLAARTDAAVIDDSVVAAVADEVTEHGLDEQQRAAAAAIAGTGRLVTVTGPAGAGKTTMLTVARHLIDAKQHRMLLVAPTKKAALVAGEETGAAATSVHGLLHEFGWRWGEDANGTAQWRRLQPGDSDPSRDGKPWPGPRAALDQTTHIIVDEAGMLDLDAGSALAALAQETGAQLAFVGDPQQLLPVGHAGAMLMARRVAPVNVELHAIHRFRNRDGSNDTAWADLSRRLREATSEDEQRAIADELIARGRVRVVANRAEATNTLVNAWFDAHGHGLETAVVVSTNEEARLVNDTIQQLRIDRGQLDPHRAGLGAHGQRILVGDVVQSRRNNTELGLDNRALWRVRAITRQRIDVEAVNDPGTIRSIPAHYAANFLEVAYATTAHGIQGETLHRSIVGPDVSAAGLYVGLTRGRRLNECVVIAGNEPAAANALVEQMRRGQTDATLAEARDAVTRETHAAAHLTGQRASDWRHRNHGALTDEQLAAAIATAKQAIPHATATLQARHDQIERWRHELTTLERADAAALATSDLRKRATPLAPNPRRLDLQQAIDTLEAQLRTLHTENKPAIQRLDELQQERTIRGLVLTEPQRAIEDHQRAAATRQRPLVDSFAPYSQPTPTSRGPQIGR